MHRNPNWLQFELDLLAVSIHSFPLNVTAATFPFSSLVIPGQVFNRSGIFLTPNVLTCTLTSKVVNQACLVFSICQVSDRLHLVAIWLSKPVSLCHLYAFDRSLVRVGLILWLDRSNRRFRA